MLSRDLLLRVKVRFASALKARNRLIHGWYERHSFKIQTDEGRDVMIADLEKLHTELFEAWQIAQALVKLTTDFAEGVSVPHFANPAGQMS